VAGAWFILTRFFMYISLYTAVAINCDVVGRISVNGAVVQDLLEAADMLQLRHVVDACCSFLLQQLHESNCIGL